MSFIQNRFEGKQFPPNDLYSALLKEFSLASTNFGKFSQSPFILSQMNMEKYRRGIGVGIIRAVPVEDNRGICEELALDIVVFITFAISDISGDSASLCILNLDLDLHSTC